MRQMRVQRRLYLVYRQDRPLTAAALVPGGNSPGQKNRRPRNKKAHSTGTNGAIFKSFCQRNSLGGFGHRVLIGSAENMEAGIAIRGSGRSLNCMMGKI